MQRAYNFISFRTRLHIYKSYILQRVRLLLYTYYLLNTKTSNTLKMAGLLGGGGGGNKNGGGGGGGLLGGYTLSALLHCKSVATNITCQSPQHRERYHKRAARRRPSH